MKIPKIFRNTIIYTLVSVLQKGVSFLLLPIYTLYLAPSDYGILGVSSSITSFLAIFTTLSLGAASTRFYFSKKEDPIYVKKLFGTVVTSVCLNSVFVGAVFILLHKWLVNPILGDISFYPYIFLGILNVIVTPLYLYFQEYLRTLQSGFYYGVNSMAFFFIQILLNLLFLIVFHWGVIGILSANLITSIIFFIYSFIVFSRRITLGIDKPILKECLRYSLPLLPHQLANWSNGTIDRLLVNGLKSQADAGLYNLGQQYGSLLNNVINGVNDAYVPWFFDKVNNGDSGKKEIYNFAEAAIWIISLIALLMSIFAKEILGIMIQNPEYDSVWMVVPCVSFSFVFQCIYFFYVNVLFLKHTKDVFKITVSTIVVNVLLNVVLIPIMGFIGCGIAFMVTHIAKSTIALFFSKKREPSFRFRTLSMYGVAMVTFGLSISPMLFLNIGVWEMIVIKCIICVALGGFVYFKFNNTILSIIARWKA